MPSVPRRRSLHMTLLSTIMHPATLYSIYTLSGQEDCVDTKHPGVDITGLFLMYGLLNFPPHSDH